MPPKADSEGIASAFAMVRKRARVLLVKLRKDIRAREAEIRRLRMEEASLGSLTGRAAGASRPTRGVGRSKRVNWSAVLQQLPNEFTAAHVRSIGAAKNKRSSEVFAAITRWIQARVVRRKSRGVYERAQ